MKTIKFDDIRFLAENAEHDEKFEPLKAHVQELVRSTGERRCVWEHIVAAMLCVRSLQCDYLEATYRIENVLNSSPRSKFLIQHGEYILAYLLGYDVIEFDSSTKKIPSSVRNRLDRMTAKLEKKQEQERENRRWA